MVYPPALMGDPRTQTIDRSPGSRSRTWQGHGSKEGDTQALARHNDSERKSRWASRLMVCLARRRARTTAIRGSPTRATGKPSRVIQAKTSTHLPVRPSRKDKKIESASL